MHGFTVTNTELGYALYPLRTNHEEKGRSYINSSQAFLKLSNAACLRLLAPPCCAKF